MKIPRWYACIGVLILAFAWITPNWLGFIGKSEKDGIRNVSRAPDGKQQKYYSESEAVCLDASNIAFLFGIPIWALGALAVCPKHKNEDH